MVPSAFVALEALPLTPVGKVDRKALPAPEYSALQEAEYIAPRTPTEKVLADIWCDVLKRKGLSINEDFFELGGNSLLAMQVLSRVRYAFEVDLSWRSLFESPTVEQMNASILRSSETRQQVEKRAEIMLKVATLSDSEVDTLLTAELAGPGMESTWP
jgi:aryl carrier-like protein